MDEGDQGAAWFRIWSLWGLFLASAALLFLNNHRWPFVLTLLVTQASLYAALVCSKSAARTKEVLRTQSLFWSMFIISQCLVDGFTRLFDSFGVRFPFPTQLWLTFHGAVAGTPIIWVPLISLALAAPLLWFDASGQRARVARAERMLSWSIVPYALAAMVLALFPMSYSRP